MLVAVVALAMASTVDQQISISWRGFGGPHFADFMGRSLFEGAAFGFGDIGTLSHLTAFIVYLGVAARRDRLLKMRPELGYLAFAAAVGGLCIQGIKVLMARPRPGGDFLPFWQLSQTAPDRLFGSGSFPSGHTAQIALLLGFVYTWQRTTLRRRYGAACAVFLAAAGMGFSRVVSFKHWLTDTVASIFLCWLLLHVSYYRVLRIPEQRWYLEQTGSLPRSWPRFWELELVFWATLAITGAAASAAIWRGGYKWAWILSGVMMAVGVTVFVRRRKQLLAQLGVRSS